MVYSTELVYPPSFKSYSSHKPAFRCHDSPEISLMTAASQPFELSPRHDTLLIEIFCGSCPLQIDVDIFLARTVSSHWRDFQSMPRVHSFTVDTRLNETLSRHLPVCTRRNLAECRQSSPMPLDIDIDQALCKSPCSI